MIKQKITGLTANSQKVQPGNVFVALEGASVSGRQYIEEALKKGAVAILAESPKASVGPHSERVIIYPQLSEALGFIAARFFSDPSRYLPVIGITGTNGKTSCAYLIAHLFQVWAKACGVIGTLGVGFVPDLEPMGHTTPDAIAVQRYLADFRDKGACSVVMEVSSHALVQGRVNGVRFNTAIFTNFTRDHLDYHKDMESYWQAKKKLWTEHEVQYAVINIEDPKAIDLIKSLLTQKRIAKHNIIGYTTTDLSFINREAFKGIIIIKTVALYLDTEGIEATIQTPWGRGQIKSSLLGRFNLSNMLAALAAVCIQGMPFERALMALSAIPPIPGRMMCLGGKKAPLVVVDYAHTPDALKQVLQALRAHCRGKLWCIFGCGGERDRGKRPIMANIAETLSDEVIMTLDNPRMEAQTQIFSDMVSGFKKNTAFTIEPDRISAIHNAILRASSQDVILIAGKGHEKFQIIGTVSEPLDDYEEAVKALRSRG